MNESGQDERLSKMEQRCSKISNTETQQDDEMKLDKRR